MPENNYNKKQDIEIAIIKRDIHYIKEDIKEIKDNHLKCIQEEIENLKDVVLKQPNWKLLSTIVGIGTFILGILITIIGYLIQVH